MKNLTHTNTQLIELNVENNQPMVTSIQVAVHFNKRHADVLRAIETTKALIVDDDFYKRNFALIEKDVEIPISGGIRKAPAYLMTRDGFSLLAMGFTGKRAMTWKIKYINTFNQMEAELRNKKLNKYLDQTIDDQLEADRAAYSRDIIEGLLGFWAVHDEMPYSTVNKLLCAHLYISSLDDLQLDHFRPAFSFIIQSACFLPNEDQEIAPEKMENIQRLLSACSRFKYSNNLNAETMLHSLCGASIHNLPTIDSARLLELVWGIFQHSHGYTLGFINGQKEIIKDMVQ